MKNAFAELAIELAITSAIIAVSVLFHELNLALRAIVGPQWAPIAWIALTFIALAGITTYLIKSGNKAA
jgi:hypothetical protein